MDQYIKDEIELCETNHKDGKNNYDKITKCLLWYSRPCGDKCSDWAKQELESKTPNTIPKEVQEGFNSCLT